VKKGHADEDNECVYLLCWLACGAELKKEPFLRDGSEKVHDKDLRGANFMAYGVWERQRVAIFDNHILDADDAPSHFDRNTSYMYVTAMRAAVQEKRNST